MEKVYAAKTCNNCRFKTCVIDYSKNINGTYEKSNITCSKTKKRIFLTDTCNNWKPCTGGSRTVEYTIKEEAKIVGKTLLEKMFNNLFKK